MWLFAAVANSASTVPSSWGLTCSFDLADRGALHKAISLENDIHIIEETQLFQDFEPIQSLLLSSKKVSPQGAGRAAPHFSDHSPGWARQALSSI